MRKALIVVLTLLLSLSAFAMALTIKINHQADEKAFALIDLIGDSSSINNLSISFNSTYAEKVNYSHTLELNNGTLLSNITHSVKYSPKIYDFHDEGDVNIQYDAYNTWMAEVFFSELKNGESSTKLIKLKDYFEYLPLNVIIHYSYLPDNYQELEGRSIIADSFKIPTPEDLYFEMSAYRNHYGYIEISEVTVISQSFYLYGFSVLMEKGALIWLTDENSKTGLDFSHFEKGYGIYLLPMLKDGKYDIYNLDIFYPLDASEKIVKLEKNENGKLLYLYTHTEEGYYLSVIDINSAELIDKDYLCDAEKIDGSLVDDNLLAIYLDNNTFIYSVDNDGKLTRFCTCKVDKPSFEVQTIPEFDHFDDPNYRLKKYNDLVCLITQSHSSSLGFFIYIYDSEGLRSLSRIDDLSYSYYYDRISDARVEFINDSLQVNW